MVDKISKIIPKIDQNIDHKEIGTPRTHRKFLGRFEEHGPIPNKNYLDFQCHLIRQKSKIYIAWGIHVSLAKVLMQLLLVVMHALIKSDQN